MLIPKTPVMKPDKAFRKWLSQFPCIKCRKHGRTQIAHLYKKYEKAKGRQGKDCQVAPLCCDGIDWKGCHEKLDQYKECDREWWEKNLMRLIAHMLMVYKFWKAKRHEEAEYLLRSFK